MWWYPRNRLSANRPIDFEEVNEDLRQVVSLMEGNLGEHNWNLAAITRPNVATAAVLVVNRTSTDVDPDLENAGGAVLPARIPPGPAGSVRIPTSGEYVVVTGLSLSNVDTGNSLVWILASFQFMQSSIANSGGLQCALRIDGTTIPETVTGTLDTTNDRWGENMMADTGNTTTGGIAFVLDAILDVTPGRHTIEVVAKSNKPADIPMMLFGDNVIDTLSEYAPNLKDIILHRQVITPWDLEQEFGLTEGNIFQGELTLDQLFFLRPVPGWAKYRTPIRNLYMCGACTHPGGGVMAASGRLAALEILKDWRL